MECLCSVSSGNRLVWKTLQHWVCIRQQRILKHMVWRLASSPRQTTWAAARASLNTPSLVFWFFPGHFPNATLHLVGITSQFYLRCIQRDARGGLQQDEELQSTFPLLLHRWGVTKNKAVKPSVNLCSFMKFPYLIRISLGPSSKDSAMQETLVSSPGSWTKEGIKLLNRSHIAASLFSWP